MTSARRDDVVGPLAREVFARFTAIDLRPQVTPVHGFRPGSVARTPGVVVCEGEDRFLMLFGAALGAYVWTVVADAARTSAAARSAPTRSRRSRSRRPPRA